MNPNPIKIESIVKDEFIFYLNVIFGIITANGKSIGEVREKDAENEQLKLQ
jgi:hypothetical protein